MSQTEFNSNEAETLDDILDETLDDLADMPETKPFPAGAHAVALIVKKNAKKAGSYIVEMTHKEVIELTDSTANAPVPGDKSTVFISTIDKKGQKNEFGQGALKMVLKPIGEMLGTNSISQILETAKNGVDAIVVVGIRKSKDEQYDDQQQIKSVQLA